MYMLLTSLMLVIATPADMDKLANEADGGIAGDHDVSMGAV
jgi:hypothetical protein